MYSKYLILTLSKILRSIKNTPLCAILLSVSLLTFIFYAPSVVNTPKVPVVVLSGTVIDKYIDSSIYYFAVKTEEGKEVEKETDKDSYYSFNKGNKIQFSTREYDYKGREFSYVLSLFGILIGSIWSVVWFCIEMNKR